MRAFRARTDPLVLRAIRALFNHPCGRRKDKCPHLSPEERSAFDGWMQPWLNSLLKQED